MVVLNLYPKGTLEYTKTEIFSTGFNNKATIAIKDITSIELSEPSMFKNGNIKINATTLDREIQFIFTKKRLADAKIAYNEILLFIEEYRKNNPQPEIEENFEENNIPAENTAENINPDVFECEISEGTVAYTHDRTVEHYKATVILHEDYLEIIKSSLWRGKDRGSKELLYKNVTSVDLDIGGFLKWHAIELTASGSEIICLLNIDKDATTTFYNHIKEVIREYNLNQEKRVQQPVQQESVPQNTTSDADELMKWHQMMEQGIITQEEFEHKKKEILGL